MLAYELVKPPGRHSGGEAAIQPSEDAEAQVFAPGWRQPDSKRPALGYQHAFYFIDTLQHSSLTV